MGVGNKKKKCKRNKLQMLEFTQMFSHIYGRVWVRWKRYLVPRDTLGKYPLALITL